MREYYGTKMQLTDMHTAIEGIIKDKQKRLEERLPALEREQVQGDLKFWQEREKDIAGKLALAKK